jgi:hypothetical protein
MAKSFVSALVGVALHEGYSESIDDPIRDYLPVLSSPTFDGVTIKHVLGRIWLGDGRCSPSKSPGGTHRARLTGAVATVG